MNKPQIPKDLPHWVCWLAQDANGRWWAFEAEPNEYDQGWYENEVGRCLQLNDGARIRIGGKAFKNITPKNR